eukprot:3590528-Prymnesium_polylepis.1
MPRRGSRPTGRARGKEVSERGDGRRQRDAARPARHARLRSDRTDGDGRRGANVHMATAGHGLTLMPVSSGSLVDGVKARLTLAAHKARELGDPGLNLMQHEIDEADWASH